MHRLPLDHRGYPIPWFVWRDEHGKEDFRIMDTDKRARAMKHDLCWLCGQPLGRYKTFVAGPMCVVTRTSAEPPSHYECAKFAVLACPFLLLPRAQRRDANLPEGCRVDGVMNPRNPGVSALLTSMHRWTMFKDGMGGWLIEMPEKYTVEWYAQGRTATRDEILEAIDSGMPTLRAMADKDNSHDSLDEYYRLVVSRL